MMKRASRTGAGRFLVLGLAVALVAAQPASAEKLADIIPNIYGGDGIVLADPPNGHDARFTPRGATQFDDLAQALATGLGQFSSGQAVASFVFDPAQAIFVRSEDTLGPLVAERADTIGKGKINFGMSYSKLKFKQFEGNKLNNLQVAFPHADTCAGNGGGLWSPGDNPVFCTPISEGGMRAETDPRGVPSFLPTDPIPGPNPGFEADVLTVDLDIELEQQIIGLFANYGILDNLEVGVVLPLVDTRLEVNAVARTTGNFDSIHRFCTTINVPGQGNPFDPSLLQYNPGSPGAPANASVSAGCDGVTGGNFRPEARDLTTSSGKNEAFGIGDLTMRGKWHAVQADGWIPDIGVLGRISAPTGDEDDLLGSGEWNFAAFFVASARYGWVSPHANLGFDINTAGTEFYDFRYVVGADFRLHERVTLATDILGRRTFKSEIAGDSLVDGSVGMKVNVIGTLNVFGNAIIPINRSSGLRTDVAWTVGWEATF